MPSPGRSRSSAIRGSIRRSRSEGVSPPGTPSRHSSQSGRSEWISALVSPSWVAVVPLHQARRATRRGPVGPHAHRSDGHGGVDDYREPVRPRRVDRSDAAWATPTSVRGRSVRPVCLHRGVSARVHSGARPELMAPVSSRNRPGSQQAPSGERMSVSRVFLVHAIDCLRDELVSSSEPTRRRC